MNFSRNNWKQILLSVILGLLVGIPFGHYAINHLTPSEPKVVAVEPLEKVPKVKELEETKEDEITIEIEPVKEMETYIEESFISEDIQKVIYEASEEYGISYPLLLAMVETESSGQPNVISRTNDYGLMQINRQNHGWLRDEHGITDFLDPSQNLKAGCIILQDLIEKYEDVHPVLMAYNMGEGGAKNQWKKGNYSSSYSRKIVSRMDELEVIWEGMENEEL